MSPLWPMACRLLLTAPAEKKIQWKDSFPSTGGAGFTSPDRFCLGLQERKPQLSPLQGACAQAFDIMRVTHGREHGLIEDLILLLEECDANIRAS
ncbi:hypothetical protein MDA_GLEAN10010503 [Myotis davidii]|uniref:Uncharacterized protein n=1 Tax=Myotis davidii TaxID=225400 RepID=L5MCE1_MYODS|nr:hypothetical protein MDA_GLEAN10010503 [Myotis davidii]